MSKFLFILVVLGLVGCNNLPKKTDSAPKVNPFGALPRSMMSPEAKEFQDKKQAEATAAFEARNAEMLKAKGKLADVPLILISGNPSIERYIGLRPNMTQTQVRALLGEPSKVEEVEAFGGPFTRFIYLQCPEICTSQKFAGPNVALLISFNFRGDEGIQTNGLNGAYFSNGASKSVVIVSGKSGSMRVERAGVNTLVSTMNYSVRDFNRRVIEEYETIFVPKSKR